MMDQKLVMSHVFGHCDFFKNNAWFSKTNRKMVDQMANHATRIRRYIDRYGYETVEKFIDVCLSIENLIDRHSILNGPQKMTETKPSALDELLQNSGAREKLRRGAVDHPDVTGTLRLGPDETHTAAQIQSALNRAGKQKPRPSFRRQAGGALGVAGGLAAAGSVLQALMSRGHNAGND